MGKKLMEFAQCDNCGLISKDIHLKCKFPDIPGLAQRLNPGGVVPLAQCPVCKALMYPVELDDSTTLLNHAFTIAFSVTTSSEAEQVTAQELLTGLERRFIELKEEACTRDDGYAEILEACGAPLETYDELGD